MPSFILTHIDKQTWWTTMTTNDDDDTPHLSSFPHILAIQQQHNKDNGKDNDNIPSLPRPCPFSLVSSHPHHQWDNDGDVVSPSTLYNGHYEHKWNTQDISIMFVLFVCLLVGFLLYYSNEIILLDSIWVNSLPKKLVQPGFHPSCCLTKELRHYIYTSIS